MIIPTIKKFIPYRLKVRLKELLVTPEPILRENGSAGSKILKKNRVSTKLNTRSRPCATKWPREVCECEMHLGAFKRSRLRSKFISLLEKNGLEYVDGLGGKAEHIAVPIASLEQVLEVIQRNGFVYEAKKVPTKINEYDFPVRSGGEAISSLVPIEHTEIRLQPFAFCASRRPQALAMSVLVTTFNDVDGLRLFHSDLARVRTRSIGQQWENSRSVLPEDPIDIVITTVDGSDPAWVEKFNATLAAQSQEPALAKTVNAARYTNRDELRFVLRSIHYYADYVRKIHIVTDAQRPGWLDVDHPRINLVDHREIIDSDYLPTFNSDAIESCIHRIPGLAERFIYFNDDVILMAPTTELTFFTSHGLPRFYPSPRKIPDIPAGWTEAYTMHAHLRSAAALEDHGFPRPIYKYKHVPFVARKSTIEKMEVEFSNELAETRNSRIRSETSFATISFLYPNYALATRSGVISQIAYQYMDLSWPDWKDRLVKICERTDVTVACINESHDVDGDSDEVNSTLTSILRSRFPAVAPWELANRHGEPQMGVA